MQPDALDPQAVDLAKAIRQTESGGDFTARGKSGEYGAYQYTPATWANDAKAAGVDVPLQHATPEQQNQVAYTKIKNLKDQGLNVGQVASAWNAGQGEHDAYTGTFSNGHPSVGTNKYGVHFDVPAYAKSVATAYQSIKAGGQPQADPNNPSSTANQTLVQPPAPQTDPNAPDTYGATFKADAGDNPLVAGAKAIGNLPSSFLHLGGGLLDAALHPVKTVEGIGSGIVGGVENLTGQNQGNPDSNQQTANAIGKAFMDRYGSLENAQRTATNDPAGFGTDVLSVLTGGEGLARGGAGLVDAARGGTAASDLVDTGVNAMKDATQKVVNPVVKGVGAVASAPVKLAGATMGLQTGVGGQAIAEGLNASAKGGDASKAFIEGLRGNANPDELVQQARDSLDEVQQNRNATYQDMLGTLSKDPTSYDISPVTKAVDNGLSGLKIGKNPDGTLDFSRSKIRFNTSAQNDVNTIYNEMKTFGLKAGDRSATGIDDLKQSFYDLDKPSSSVRAFTTSVAKTTRGVLENAPGYSKAMKDYADVSDQIKNIKQSLSLGDKASVETSFKKLTSSLKNNDFRRQVIQELDQTTGGNLLPKIAGHQLSSIVPRGLAGVAEGGIASVSGMLRGAGGILPLLGLAITTSPRVVGEFVHTLGLGLRGTNKVMSMLNRFATPAVEGANANNRLNPQEGLLSQLQTQKQNTP